MYYGPLDSPLHAQTGEWYVAAGASSLEAYDCQKNRVTRRNATHWQIDEYYQGPFICVYVGDVWCGDELCGYICICRYVSKSICVTHPQTPTRRVHRGARVQVGPIPAGTSPPFFSHQSACSVAYTHTDPCLQPHRSLFHSFMNLHRGGTHTYMHPIPSLSHPHPYTHIQLQITGLSPPWPRPPGPDGVAPRGRRLGVRGRLPHAGLAR